MKVQYIIFIILVVVIAIVFYLINTFYHKEKISKDEILKSNDIKLDYRYTTMRGSNTFNIIINENDSKFELYGFEEEPKISTIIDSEDINLIKEALIIGEVNTWDGFDGVDKHVLDGEMFNLKLEINGIKVSASGSNKFPKKYWDFKNKINELVKKYDIIE